MMFQDYTDVRSRYISLGAIVPHFCANAPLKTAYLGMTETTMYARLTRIATMATPVDSHLISMTLVETTSNVKTEQTK